jgi:hypothetical protein
MCNCPEETCNNLCGCEEGLLTSGAPEIASLFEPSVQSTWRTLKLELLADDVVLKDTVIPRLREIEDDFVYTLIRELEHRASPSRAHAFRVIVAQNTTN